MNGVLAVKAWLRPLVHRVRLVRSYLRWRWSPPKVTALEIGAGPVRRAGWLTLDLDRGADVYWDLRRPLPFRDTTFEKVYCCHVLEHFAYPELKRVLADVRRVLVPGGEFLIAVPDASLYVEAYLGKRDPATLVKYAPAVISLSPMDVLNYIFYMGGHHKHMFDERNLALHLEAAGFAGCRKRAFDPALDPAVRDYETLYFRCERGR